MIILAQRSVQDLSAGFTNYVAGHRRSFFDITVLTLAVLVLLLLAVQITAFMRARRKPRLLFYDLALLHNLPHGTRRRLLNIAKVHRVTDPAYLFVCPDLVRRIKSLEMSHAASQRERKRLDEFFTEFEKAVFG